MYNKTVKFDLQLLVKGNWTSCSNINLSDCFAFSKKIKQIPSRKINVFSTKFNCFSMRRMVVEIKTTTEKAIYTEKIKKPIYKFN